MASATIRKVIRLGGSLAITLPPAWAKGRLLPGDEVAMIADGELRIVLIHERGSRAGKVIGEESG